ncbi:MAG: LPXTG cell wall anchor domain-containing protein [Candidatus Ventricola sp.]
MGYKRMRLPVLLAAVLMLLCGAQAIAESMTAVPADRIRSVALPAGVVMVGEPVIRDGKVVVYVDDDKTNWTEVLLKAAASNMLAATLTVDAPEGAVAGTRENFGAGDPETLSAISQGTVPDWFADYSPGPLAQSSLDGSAVFAEVQFGQPAFYVEPVSASGAGTVLAWKSSDGQRQYEYVQWEIHHSNPDAREVQKPLLTTDTLSSVPAALPAGVKAEIEPGGVTCTVEDFSALSSLPIVIHAPEGATAAVVYAYNGKETVEETVEVHGGTVRLTITPSSHTTFRDRIGPAQLDYSIAFVTGDEPEMTLLDFGAFSVWLLAKEKVPYPYYNQQGARPVESERLTIRQGATQISNEAVYRETYGNAHLSKAALDFSASSSGNVRLEVTAPSWAAAYGLSGSGGDFIYQNDWGLYISSDKHPISSGETVSVYDLPFFRTVQTGQVLVYLQDGITARYGGYVYVISWYDDISDKTPRLVEYLSITHDTFSETVRNAVVDTEQDIVRAVQEVTAVSGNAWELVVRHDPQSGENAIHYDLQMEDARRVSYSLNGDTVFYIPYPEGCAYGDEDVTYQLYHYDDTYQSYTVVELVPTPYGLRFVEDHLSPFVLTWSKGPQDAAGSADAPEIDLPQTGDKSHLEGLIGVLAVSMALLAVIWRRRSA